MPLIGPPIIPIPTVITFAGSWANLGSGYEGGKYYKDASSRVHLMGMVTGGADGTTIGILPSGFRPANKHRFTQLANSALGTVDVLNTGAITAITTNGGWVALDGISFLAEA